MTARFSVPDRDLLEQGEISDHVDISTGDQMGAEDVAQRLVAADVERAGAGKGAEDTAAASDRRVIPVGDVAPGGEVARHEVGVAIDHAAVEVERADERATRAERGDDERGGQGGVLVAAQRPPGAHPGGEALGQRHGGAPPAAGAPAGR